jgi:hypothetical protein
MGRTLTILLVALAGCAPPRVNEYGKHLAFDSRATRDAERRVGMFLDEVVGKGRGQ